MALGAKNQSKDDPILQACREALLELKSLHEREALLKQQVAELRDLSDLKEERIVILQSVITEYEKAIEARKRAEVAVELLRQNYEAQLKTAEKQLNNEKRKVKLWQVVSGALLLITILGLSANRN